MLRPIGMYLVWVVHMQMVMEVKAAEKLNGMAADSAQRASHPPVCPPLLPFFSTCKLLAFAFVNCQLIMTIKFEQV